MPENSPRASAQDVRTRTFSWHDPKLSVQPALSMSGLEFIRKVMNGEADLPPIMELVSFRFVKAEPGEVTCEFEPAEFHYNPIGAVHGGIACTLLDSAMSCSVYASLPAGMVFTTLHVDVSFVRPISLETGVMRCEGKVVHSGSRIATAEARLIDMSGKIYAHGTTTCLVFPTGATASK